MLSKFKETLVISAYPCCGKTYAFEHFKDQYDMLDSDSSLFSWIYDENGNKTDKRNPEFPDNYIKHIKENLGKVDIIFVSSHLVVREAMRDAGINFHTVYPRPDSLHVKIEWLNRMAKRGSDENFIKFQSENWSKFTDSIISEPYGKSLVFLGENGYIDNAIKIICNDIKGDVSNDN